MAEEFEGFPPPTKNFFSLPNEMINIVAHIKNLAELKVIIYVIRHTWGYHEYGIYKTISVDEFMHGRKREDGSRMDQGTGLSNRSVIDGLRAAVQHGYLICDVDASDLARVKKSYALRMINRGELSSPHEDTSYSEETTHSYEDTSLGYEESSQLGEDTSYRSEKYTNRKTLKKDTIEKQVFDASASTSAPVTDLHKWRTDSEKRRAMFADIPPSQDIEEDISMLETRKQEATNPSQQTPAATVQAPSLLGDTAQPATPHSGAVQASSKRTRKKVTQAKPAITLTAQEQAFWELWCGVWFNQDIKPELNETACKHVVKLAPYITTSEQLNSLIDYTRKDLAASQNIKRKMVQLGNMVFCYPGWKQSQQEPARKNGKAPGKPDAYGNDYSLTALIARQQKAM